MPVTIDEVERVVAELRKPDSETRNRLMEELRAWEKEPLPPAAAEKVLRGAAEVYPAVEGWPPTPNENLIQVLWNGPQAEPQAVLAIYPRLDNGCRAARAACE